MFLDEKPQGEVQPKVGTLKLSEAIRIGAKIRPQCFDDYYSNGKSCALAAAFEGVTGKRATAKACPSPADWAIKHFGISHGLVGDIIGQNDCFRWTREEIADWLEPQGY